LDIATSALRSREFIDPEGANMTKPPDVDKLLYTPVEAAHALGISRSTVYVLMASGDLPSVRIGSSRRISADALRRYVTLLSSDDGSGRQWKLTDRQEQGAAPSSGSLLLFGTSLPNE
jgi:excisionase family DNA binding protein